MELSKVIYVSKGTFRQKIFFIKIFLGFQIFSGTWPEKVSAFRQTFLGRFEKTAFYVSMEIFWGKFREKNISLSFLDNEHKFGRKNSILRVLGNFLRKLFLRKV